MRHFNRLLQLTSLLVLPVIFIGCKDESAIPKIDNATNDAQITEINNIIDAMNEDSNKAPNTDNNAPPVSVISINDASVYSESYDPEGEVATQYWTVDEKVISQDISFNIADYDFTGNKEVSLYVYDGNSIGYSSDSVQFKASTTTSDDSSDDDSSDDDYPYDY